MIAAMTRVLIISVRLHDSRYHGVPEWPPSPARLFQAILAGAARGNLSDVDRDALGWLEALDAPAIGSPRARQGQRFKTYVPNNDLDAVGRDPSRTNEIRTDKWIKPRLFDAEPTFLYAWTFRGSEEDESCARTICAMASRLYQFGRGVDMAWAWGEVLDFGDLEARLSGYPGMVHRPSDGGTGIPLACPERGSLVSLDARHAASCRRFRPQGQGEKAKQLFTQPPKPHFVQVPYDSPPSRRVYDVCVIGSEPSFAPWPLTQATGLVEVLRDLAAERLRHALPGLSSEIERVLVGRKADGADDGPTSLRVKIVPLPSIGHDYADRGIRRVLVEVPASCPLSTADVHWAFSGLELNDSRTGEVLNLILTPAEDDTMLPHYYGAADRLGFRVWRTVTPAALPEPARRRRIEPARMMAESKGGAERAAEEGRAALAVTQALRHADVRPRADAIRVQREPFEARGDRVEAFARRTRFAKERLWHVEITFSEPIAGTLVIGDGRFLGLGVMAPVQRSLGVHAFIVEHGLVAATQPSEVTRALRRAVMARVHDVLGVREPLPTFFCGHEPDDSPARSAHLSFVFDPLLARLLILAPHVLDRRAPTRQEDKHLRALDAALTGFRELRAASAGRLALSPTSIDADTDPLFAASRTWENATPYQVTRHTKRVGAAEALAADLRGECRRRSLPEPRVTPREPHGVQGVGLVGGARLTFEVAVKGPVLLGRSRHLGGGLFVGTGR